MNCWFIITLQLLVLMITSFCAGGLVEGWIVQIAGGEKIFHTQVTIIGVHILIFNPLRQLDLFFSVLHIKLQECFSNIIGGKMKFMKSLPIKNSFQYFQWLCSNQSPKLSLEIVISTNNICIFLKSHFVPYSRSVVEYSSFCILVLYSIQVFLHIIQVL
jgi:hypothetical protein